MEEKKGRKRKRRRRKPFLLWSPAWRIGEHVLNLQYCFC
jgi:hypothetical protein